MSGAYLIYYLRQESLIRCVDSSWNSGVVHTIMGHFEFDFGLISRVLCLEHISYITNNFPQMCARPINIGAFVLLL